MPEEHLEAISVPACDVIYLIWDIRNMCGGAAWAGILCPQLSLMNANKKKHVVLCQLNTFLQCCCQMWCDFCAISVEMGTGTPGISFQICLILQVETWVDPLAFHLPVHL